MISGVKGGFGGGRKIRIGICRGVETSGVYIVGRMACRDVLMMCRVFLFGLWRGYISVLRSHDEGCSSSYDNCIAEEYLFKIV